MKVEYSYDEVYKEMVEQGFDGLHEEKYYMANESEKYGFKMLEFTYGLPFVRI